MASRNWVYALQRLKFLRDHEIDATVATVINNLFLHILLNFDVFNQSEKKFGECENGDHANQRVLADQNDHKASDNCRIDCVSGLSNFTSSKDSESYIQGKSDETNRPYTVESVLLENDMSFLVCTKTSHELLM